MSSPKKPTNGSKTAISSTAAAPVKAVAIATPVAAPVTAPVAAKSTEPTPVPVARKAEEPKPAVQPAVKAEAAKPAAAKPAAANPASTKVASAKPVVAKADLAPGSSVAEAVEPAKPALAASKPAPVVAASSIPVIDVMKPVAVLQENVRANTEKVITGMRSHYAEVKGMAETATTRLEDSMKAAQVGSRAFGFKLFEIAKAQTHDHLDHAKKLAAAKTLPEVFSTQQNFVLAQFRAAQERSKDVATLAGEIVQNVAAPLRASLEALTRR
jgi:hypothetical protein